MNSARNMNRSPVFSGFPPRCLLLLSGNAVFLQQVYCRMELECCGAEEIFFTIKIWNISRAFAKYPRVSQTCLFWRPSSFWGCKWPTATERVDKWPTENNKRHRNPATNNFFWFIYDLQLKDPSGLKVLACLNKFQTKIRVAFQSRTIIIIYWKHNTTFTRTLKI